MFPNDLYYVNNTFEKDFNDTPKTNFGMVHPQPHLLSSKCPIPTNTMVLKKPSTP